MNRILIIFLLTIFLISCHKNEIPKEVQTILKQTRNESLDKVLNHYSRAKDSLKFKAACFLIINMDDKGFYEGELINHFDQFFEIVNNKTKLKGKKLSEKEIEIVLDSINNTKPTNGSKYFKRDIDEISYDFLINNIDLSYKMWNEQPYARQFTFDKYLQNILPYRNMYEILDDSRSELNHKYNKWLLDSLKDKTDPVEACIKINNELKSWFIYIYELRKSPTTISTANILKGKMGTCAEMANIAAASMRSMGIPVAIDVVPQWANKQSGHSWNVVFDKNMKAIPFMGAESNPGCKSLYWDVERPAKIFRLSYKLQKFPIFDNPANIPELFKRTDFIDVTEEYVPITDIKIKLADTLRTKNYAYLCVFNNESWVPIYWGNIDNNEVVFKKMGRNIVYITSFFTKGSLITYGNPFILDKTGEINELVPDKGNFQDLILYRKYPLFPRIAGYLERMVKGKFQGANKSDFSDAIDLYTIAEKPAPFMQGVNINSDKKFRYIRYKGPDDGYSDIAEFEIYGKQEGDKTIKKLNGTVIGHGENFLIYKEAFDGNWDSYFYSKDPGKREWVGMEFNSPVKITTIKYLPRNDDNAIRIGDEYELFYWDKGWKTKGKAVASENKITFSHVPKNTLYWLRNHTRGKEERIFTSSDGNQIWW